VAEGAAAAVAASSAGASAGALPRAKAGARRTEGEELERGEDHGDRVYRRGRRRGRRRRAAAAERHDRLEVEQLREGPGRRVAHGAVEVRGQRRARERARLVDEGHGGGTEEEE